MAEQVTKRVWTEPELIVLVQNKPEEAVLGLCKMSGEATTHDAEYQGCLYNPSDDGEPCRQCASAQAS